MMVFSTRDPALRRRPAEAIVAGLAPDGGLFLPESLPAFPMDRLAGMDDLSVSVEVLSLFFDDFTRAELEDCVRAAYAGHFPSGNIAPLAPVGDAWSLELFHGPTAAFKDVALTLLPHLLTRAKEKCGIREEICILTATSGDTGSAALSGFADVPGTRITVFYPHGGVSPVQERQMTGRAGRNVSVAAVRGNFDDAQSGVKEIFATMRPPAGIRLSSANSINIGRLVPQIAYYFKAYRDLLRAEKIRMGEPVNFVVPTGNFGNILAGYFAKRMGLPVARFVCASNENNVLTDFFESGVYDRRREFHLTKSPSMDILISSNLERLVSLFCGPEKTAAYMKQLKETGVYALEEDVHAALRREFSAACADDGETAAAIRENFEKYGYLTDPHTAVAFACYRKFRASDEWNGAKTVVLSTASPFKFSRSVLTALGRPVSDDEFADMDALAAYAKTAIPAALAGLAARPVLHRSVVDVPEMQAYVMKKLEIPVWND